MDLTDCEKISNTNKFSEMKMLFNIQANHSCDCDFTVTQHQVEQIHILKLNKVPCVSTFKLFESFMIVERWIL